MSSTLFPLGKLSYQQIKKGENILKQIQEEITTTKNSQKLLSLSNQFYTNVPHIHIKIIDTLKDVKRKKKKLTYMYLS